MATIIFNKLIRDRIPEILKAKGVLAEMRTLDAKEYLDALKAKLIEEANELNRATTNEDLRSEIADVLEVLDAIVAAYGFASEELRLAQEKKRIERGGFAERQFLISTMDGQ